MKIQLRHLILVSSVIYRTHRLKDLASDLSEAKCMILLTEKFSFIRYDFADRPWFEKPEETPKPNNFNFDVTRLVDLPI